MSVDFLCSDESIPSLNYANVSARGLLKIMGLDSEYLCGSLENAEIPAVLQRLLLAINEPEARAHTITAPSDRRAFQHPRLVEDENTGLTTITRGCRVISFGNTDDQTLRRLYEIRDLFVRAHTSGSDVHWG
jgi:hypothetical protein